MSQIRHLTAGALAVLALATTVGCGQTALNAPAIGEAVSSTPSLVVQGVKRTLGYDMTRYQTVQKKNAKPQRIRQGMLPSAVDNRKFCSAVADQGQLGACTAFAMGKGLREYNQQKNGEAATPLSALFLYYEERALMGTINEDSGATITDGMTVLKKTGIATEETAPYNISVFKTKPSAQAYSSAGKWKIQEATQLAGLDDVKAAIAKGQSVPFGFMVYRSFMSVKGDGVMPMPKPGEKVMGGHAVLAVGYDDAKKALIVRNSWNTTWGDKGYFYMPYEFVTDENTGDFWTSGK